MCKYEEDNYTTTMTPEFDLFWSKLFSLVETEATAEPNFMTNFIRNFDDLSKVLLLTGSRPKATLPVL